MNAAENKMNEWSCRKWQITFLIIFTLQVGFFILFSNKNPEPLYEGKTFFAMMAGDRLNIEQELIDVQNPSLLAFPTKYNYSSRAWFVISAIRNEYYEWTPDNFWLLPMVDVLGKEFSKLLTEPRNPLDISIFEMTEGPAESVLPDLRLEYIYTNSIFKIEGAIAQRKLLSAPELPEIESQDVFPPSIVEIVVNADGYVVSATLIGTSGLPIADQQALRLAKQFVFSKEESTRDPLGLTLGKVVFYWFFKPLTQAEKK